MNNDETDEAGGEDAGRWSRRSIVGSGVAATLTALLDATGARGQLAHPAQKMAVPPSRSDGQIIPCSRVLTGEAWRDFCLRLADVGDIIMRPGVPANEIDRAEGLRFLTRLLRVSLMWNLECSDPDHPYFYQPSDEVTKPLGGDVPDCVYWSAAVDGEKDYRISGKRMRMFFMGVGSKVYHISTNGIAYSSGELTSTTMKFDPDGSFEIIASSKPQPGNWLPMKPETNWILIRQTYLDRSKEYPGSFTIERIDLPVGPPPPLSAHDMASTLQRTVDFMHGHGRRIYEFFLSLELQKHPNLIVKHAQESIHMVGGNPLVDIEFGYWTIAPDEAWILEFTPPECILWSMALYNWWMESLDYRYRPTTINKHTAKLNADGTVMLVVSARDMGIGNWLDTAGHREGYVYFRWTGAKNYPQPVCRVAKLADLKAE